MQTPKPLKKGGLLGERGARGEEPDRGPPTIEADGNHNGRRNEKLPTRMEPCRTHIILIGENRLAGGSRPPNFKSQLGVPSMFLCVLYLPGIGKLSRSGATLPPAREKRQ